jgi:ATP-dependent Lon protease
MAEERKKPQVNGPEDEATEAIELPSAIGILPLRNSVLFPNTVMPISVGREKTLKLIDEAMKGSKPIAVVSQKDPATDDPDPEGLYRYGTVARILKAIKIGGGNINLIIQGVSRVRVRRFVKHQPFILAQVDPLDEVVESGIKLDALARNLTSQFQRLVAIHPSLSGELAELAASTESPSRLADLIASSLMVSVSEKMALLVKLNLGERLEKLTEIVAREIEVTELGSKIQSKVMDEVGKSQRQYYLREQMKAIQKELGEDDGRANELAELRKQIDDAGMPKEAKEVADRELDRLGKMPPGSAEYTVSRTYLDWLVSVPWSKSTEDKLDIPAARTILDEDHYDLKDVKERILEYLAVRKLKEDLKGPILCFAGPPGVGKTSLGRSIARAMGRKFTRISLGGIRDEAEVRGHRRTYIGSLPGRILQGLRRAGTRNPVFILDEIDKVGMDFRGDPSSALLEVLDPEQNNSFSDHYLEVPFDLSQVFFITTANVLDTIPAALKDRMEVLRLPGYSEEDKLEIAKAHLIPRQLTEHGLTTEHLVFEDGAIARLITEYTSEAGVRNLEREIASICRKVARKFVEDKPEGVVNVTPESIPDFLGPVKFFREVAERTDRSGVAIGLAWTHSGGDILFVETTRMRGKGKVTITGSLGDVMKESAQAALSLIRASARRFGIEEHTFEKFDFHVHVPAGAIPKDGPSAGVTLLTSMLSLLLDRPVPSDVAMTGEITLRGKVLPVGGIKEKVLAAKRAGVSRVVLPAKNEKDLVDLPSSVQKALTFRFVSEVDQLLSEVFGPDIFPPIKTKGGGEARDEIVALG